MIRRETSRCKIVKTTKSDYSSKASAVIVSGGVAAIPTETSYGLAVDPFNSRSLKRLFEVKKRPASKPVLVLIDEVDKLPSLVSEIPDVYKVLIQHFWPGPLTLIFPAVANLPSLLTAETASIGVRISSHQAAAEICRQAGGVITATSANISGEPPARRVVELAGSLSGDIDLIVDGGDLGEVPPSTILHYHQKRLDVVREGGVHPDLIKELLS